MFCSSRNPKAGRVSHFVPSRLQKRSELALRELTNPRATNLAFRDPTCTCQIDERLAFGNSMIPEATRVSHFTSSRIQKRQGSCISQLHESKSEASRISQGGDVPEKLNTERVAVRALKPAPCHGESVTRPRKHARSERVETLAPSHYLACLRSHAS